MQKEAYHRDEMNEIAITFYLEGAIRAQDLEGVDHIHSPLTEKQTCEMKPASDVLGAANAYGKGPVAERFGPLDGFSNDGQTLCSRTK